MRIYRRKVILKATPLRLHQLFLDERRSPPPVLFERWIPERTLKRTLQNWFEEVELRDPQVLVLHFSPSDRSAAQVHDLEELKFRLLQRPDLMTVWVEGHEPPRWSGSNFQIVRQGPDTALKLHSLIGHYRA